MIRLHLLPAVAVLLVSACSEPVSTSGTLDPVVEAPPLELEVLSTRSWLVSGGDALVEVRVTDEARNFRQGDLRIELNGTDVTAQFRQVEDRAMQALLDGLPVGESELSARLAGIDEAATLTITNWPISGPIISGPHEQPFYCQTREFRTMAGELLGEPGDRFCSIETRVDYVYWSDLDEEFKPYQLQFGGLAPFDLAGIESRGRTVPYIVRVETGTVNRAVYEIAMLHDPADGDPGPWQRSEGWNGKLVYTHGGGCRGGWYQQGDSTGGVMRRGLFEQGYAVASSSLNVFGQNCNDLLASETHIMVKERFIERYGVPVYTIATGVSGGSYQSHQTADNYPGVFDGIIVAASFPDVTSATIFTVADARLLHHYFEALSPGEFSREQQQAVSGFGSWASIPNLSRGAARLDPIFEPGALPEDQGGEVSIDELRAVLYQPGAGGIRATVYDHTVNVYGEDPDTGIASRPLDNFGVQYGLGAFNAGLITARQFIDLNRDIGGYDRDMNHVFERHRADPLARRRHRNRAHSLWRRRPGRNSGDRLSQLYRSCRERRYSHDRAPVLDPGTHAHRQWRHGQPCHADRRAMGFRTGPGRSGRTVPADGRLDSRYPGRHLIADSAASRFRQPPVRTQRCLLGHHRGGTDQDRGRTQLCERRPLRRLVSRVSDAASCSWRAFGEQYRVLPVAAGKPGRLPSAAYRTRMGRIANDLRRRRVRLEPGRRQRRPPSGNLAFLRPFPGQQDQLTPSGSEKT